MGGPHKTVIVKTYSPVNSAPTYCAAHKHKMWARNAESASNTFCHSLQMQWSLTAESTVCSESLDAPHLGAQRLFGRLRVNVFAERRAPPVQERQKAASRAPPSLFRQFPANKVLLACPSLQASRLVIQFAWSVWISIFPYAIALSPSGS